MNISSSLIAKGAAGTLATTTAIGGGGVVANKLGLFDGFLGINAEPIEEPEGVNSLQRETEPKVDDISTVPGTSTETENERLPGVDEQAQPPLNVAGSNPNSGGTALTVINPSGDGAESTTVESGMGSLTQENESSSGSVNDAGNQSSDDTSDSTADTSIIVDGEGSPGEKPTNEATETAQKQIRDSGAGSGDKAKQKPTPTKWDNAFINYLKERGKNNRDITFSVKTGKDGSEDLTNNFPNFEDEEGRAKTTNKQKSIVTVTVTTTNAQLKGDDHDTKIKELKAMNDNKDWTWECKVIFSREKGDDDNLDFDGKEKIIGGEGFFNKLIANNNKEIKIKFIKNCAESRDSNKSAEYETKTNLSDDEKITSEKTFKLEKDNDTSKLKIKGGGFDVWFSETTQTRQAQTGA